MIIFAKNTLEIGESIGEKLLIGLTIFTLLIFFILNLCLAIKCAAQYY